MNIDEINSRIQELERLIAPLAEEIAVLKRQRAGHLAGKKSAQSRQQRNEKRNLAILREAEERQEEKYNRENGLVNSIASDHNLSRQTVSKILSGKVNDKPKR